MDRYGHRSNSNSLELTFGIIQLSCRDKAPNTHNLEEDSLIQLMVSEDLVCDWLAGSKVRSSEHKDMAKQRF